MSTKNHLLGEMVAQMKRFNDIYERFPIPASYPVNSEMGTQSGGQYASTPGITAERDGSLTSFFNL